MSFFPAGITPVFPCMLAIATVPQRIQPNNNTGSSLPDELTKFAKLIEQGILTSEEFERVKKDLLEGKR